MPSFNERLQNCVRVNKIPKDNDKYLGIELEFISKIDKNELATRLVREDLDDYVLLKEDGSIRPDDRYRYGHELVILVKEEEYRSVLRKIINLIKNNSRVNNTCGFHVHIDMRNRDKDKVFNNFYKTQGVLFAMNPSNRYCGQGTSASGGGFAKKTDLKLFEQAKKLLQDGRSNGYHRYHGINIASYAKFNTFEIRIHSGTINYEKIDNWIQILINIANFHDFIKPRILSPKTLCNNFNLPESIQEYIENRIEKFKSPEGNHITVEEVS